MSSTVSRWPPFAVTSLASNLASLQVVTLDEDRKLEPEIQSWLARLLVVRSAGYIEQAVAECGREHVRARSGGWIQSFAHSWLERSKNPSPENLTQFLGRFDHTVSLEFDEFLRQDDERLYRDLASLIDKRNRIAHGLNEGIGKDRAVTLSTSAVEVVDWFILKLNPLR
jgi:hypothetical protein